MARRPIFMTELDELLFRWQQGHNISQLSRSLGQSRQTVRKYLQLARTHGLSRGGDDAQRAQVLAALRTDSRQAARAEAPLRQQLLEPHAEQIRKWLQEPDMTAKQIWRLLAEQGLTLSYASVKRFLRSHIAPVTAKVTVRLETPPGQQVQVDFGLTRVRVGERVQSLWVFVMTLSYSRHRFVRFVQRQDLATWIDCHIRAFEFFGGVPRTVLLDNLKAGVVRPDLYDPTVNRAYGELERHYGFTVDPARVASPKEKGKVERQVPVVRQQLVAGRRYDDLADLNHKALVWCREQVGQVEHGTTCEPPMVRFEQQEKGALQPLPAQPFERPTWGEAKVHPDHHVVFERSYYSLPSRFVGRTVWVRATRHLVEIYCDDELVKTHPRAIRRGTWRTDTNDYPDAAKAFLFAHPQFCRKKAAEIGPNVARMVTEILSGHAIRNLRKAQGVLRLADKYGPDRLDEACDYLLHFGATELRRLTRVLEQGIPPSWQPAQEPPSAPLTEQGKGFLHPPDSFAALEVSQ
ncbi:MAG: IS21 family transposase [Desulfobulbus sp.]|nr:IS21 family transposase [Desulfobulbus sp.]